jgi:pyruvate kinase
VIGAVLPLSALTEKDQRDLDFALDVGADWVSLSFVQHHEDIKSATSWAGELILWRSWKTPRESTA